MAREHLVDPRVVVLDRDYLLSRLQMDHELGVNHVERNGQVLRAAPSVILYWFEDEDTISFLTMIPRQTSAPVSPIENFEAPRDTIQRGTAGEQK
jgi:hypothetical protein